MTAFLALPAGAEDLRLAGKFAFRTAAKPGRTSCTRLSTATASLLASPPYRCERAPLSSGKTALLCSRPGDSNGYLVFNTKAACDSERKDQANAAD